MSNPPVLQLDTIHHTFYQGDNSIHVLKGVSLDVYPGEIVALMGPSGTGKSTLLQIAGLLEHPTQGRIVLDSQDVSHLSDTVRTQLRRDSLGFVYQFHHLLPEFSALENLVLPQLNAGVSMSDAKERGMTLLQSLNLEPRAHHRPARLSGGEQQRVAILRAICNRPKVLLADEPTGNLDPGTSDIVFEQLLSLVRTERMGALIATHNPDLARRMDRILHLSTDGVREEKRP